MTCICFSRVLNRVNDDTHVVHRERSARRNLVIPIEPRLARASQCDPEILCIPLSRRNRIFTEQVQMTESMVIGSVQFDETVVGSLDIGVKEATGACTAENVADISQRGEELRARLDLFLIRGLHIFRTPAEVPDCRSELPRRGSHYFVEEKPRLLGPHRILVEEPALFAIELACVELHRRSRIGRVEVQVMKVCRGLRRSRRTDAQNQKN